MLVNSITNFKYGMSNALANHKQDAPQPQPVKDEGLTASIYFGSKKDKSGNTMRKATMAFVVPMVIGTTVTPALQSCNKDEVWSKSESKSESYSSSSDTTNVYVSTHAKGCCCCDCRKHRDTVYVDVPGPTEYITLPGDTVYLPGDTVKLPGDTIHHTDTVHHHDTTYVEVPKEIPIYIYVDTGSYHVVHDTIEKWKDEYVKPIPLDTLDKIVQKFDIDGTDPKRRNIVSYQGIREWEYGERFVTMMNQLQSNKYTLVYDREDLDWEGNHTGWGKDVYRYPRTSFKIQTYEGKTLTNPKGLFVETYKNPFDSEISDISDNELISRQFIQTRGDSVFVFTYDKKTGLYREDGRVSAGYLDKATKGSNILFTDLIASDPDKQFSRDPEYSTEDHLVACKVNTVNDEELKLLYVRAKDDDVAEKLYGVTNNGNTRGAITRSGAIANPWGIKF